MTRFQQITGFGQALWLDFISRELLVTGQLRELINEGLTGQTSNPTIFQKAISGGSEYDVQIRELVRAGKNATEIYEALAIQDIGDAADNLRPIYNETHARDGFISIEVSPKLAHDTDGTIAEARRLHAAIGRPNVMIKVPATEAGIPAIRTLIGDGIHVNVTLIFSVAMYEKVMEAYLGGLQTLHDRGKPLGLVASVASFFVSRVDTVVDKLLAERVKAGETGLDALVGQAAIANAKVAYDCYKKVFEGSPFAALKKAGGRVQRPLWASTSTKNPNYPSTKYIDTLIGPNTVNTVPMDTLDAIRQHSSPARTIDMDVEQAYGVMEKLATVGINMGQVTEQLLIDGVKSFADSFEKMLGDVEAKRAKLATRTT